MKQRKNIMGTLNEHLVIYLIVIFIIIFIIYFIYIYPLLHLNRVQSKEEVINTNQLILKGLIDNNEYKKIENKSNALSYWYIYNHVFLEKDTLIFLIYKCNMFSDKFNIVIYGLDENDTYFFKKKYFYLKDITVIAKENETIITCGSLFTQKINTLDNKLTLSVDNFIDIQIDITDYNTCCPCLLNYYKTKPFNNLVQMSQGNCPNIWATDNQMIGTVTYSNVNGNQSTSGNYWTDNFIGFNNYILTDYFWSVSQTDDWLLYFLWFGDKNTIENGWTNAKAICVKNKKDNTMICCGMNADCAPFPFNILDRIIQPHTMKLTSEHDLGDEIYDNYSIYFKMDDFECNINSIQNKSKIVCKIDYYDSEDVDETLLNEWELEYYTRIKNIQYVEYINEVNITINYKGENSEFKTKNIVDGMVRKNKSIPAHMNC